VLGIPIPVYKRRERERGRRGGRGREEEGRGTEEEARGESTWQTGRVLPRQSELLLLKKRQEERGAGAQLKALLQPSGAAVLLAPLSYFLLGLILTWQSGRKASWAAGGILFVFRRQKTCGALLTGPE
jgi:hypothetical protein